MGPFDPIAATALYAAALVLSLLMWQCRQSGAPRSSAKNEPLDKVQAWPSEAARVLTIAKHLACDLLRTALPGFLLLPQVPLGRFLRVPTNRSRTEWMKRVGGLSVDLLVCNPGSIVLSMIDIHLSEQTERSRCQRPTDRSRLQWQMQAHQAPCSVVFGVPWGREQGRKGVYKANPMAEIWITSTAGLTCRAVARQRSADLVSRGFREDPDFMRLAARYPSDRSARLSQPVEFVRLLTGQ